MIELIHYVSDEDLDLLEKYYENKVHKEKDLDRAEEIIEWIRERIDGNFSKY